MQLKQGQFARADGMPPVHDIPTLQQLEACHGCDEAGGGQRRRCEVSRLLGWHLLTHCNK